MQETNNHENNYRFIRASRQISGYNDFRESELIYAKMKMDFFLTIAKHMFKWNNLPLGLESEDLEDMLIHKGSVAFFNTYNGFYILPYKQDGTLDIYNKPMGVTAQPLNGLEGEILQIDNVPRILWDNAVKRPFYHYLSNFADRMASIQTSIEISERLARIPYVISVNDDNEDSWKRFISKVDEGYPVIFTNETINMAETVKVMPTGFSPVVLSSLWDTLNKVEGEAYSLLGTMYNVEQNKAAGVGAAETIINYANTFAMANSRLEQRKRWCDKLNLEFGIGISCEKANDYDDIIKAMMNATSNNPNESTKESVSVTETTEERSKNQSE